MNQTKDVIVGSRIAFVMKTSSTRPERVVPGLHPFFYFSVILEMEDGARWQLRDDGVVRWNEAETLCPISAWSPTLPTEKIDGAIVAGSRIDEDGLFCLTLSTGVEVLVNCAGGTSFDCRLAS